MTTNNGPALSLSATISSPATAASASVWSAPSRIATRSAPSVRIFHGGSSQSRMVKSGSSYLSQSELPVTFGVGTRDRVDRVVIEWPSGRSDEFKNLVDRPGLPVRRRAGAHAVVLKRTQAVGLVVAGVIVITAAAGLYVARRSPRYMSPASPAYEAVSRAFYHGLAALQVGLLDDARTQFASATTIVPREPASWGNLGLTNLRLGDLDAAGPALERAASLAPASADIAFLQGQLEISRGRPAEAIAHFERGVRLDPRGLRIRYALAQEVESAGGAGADTRAQGLLDEILALSPDNVAAILERARLAAKRGDAASLQDAVGKLSAHADSWPPAVLEQYRALQAAARNDPAEAARTVAVLRNVLLRVPSFREDLLAIRTPAELIADPFDRFIALPPSTSRPSPPDTGLSFATELLGAQQGSPAGDGAGFFVRWHAPPIVYAANDAGLSRVGGAAAVLPFPGGSSSPQTLGSAALSIDWNRDFRMDLVLAGAGGMRLLLQEADGTFRDVTAAAAGAGQAVTADCFGVWAADIEMDGDSTSSSA